MTITNVSNDDLFDGIFQQKILVVDKMIFQQDFVNIVFCCPLIQSLICYALYFRGYIISFKYMPVKLFLVAERIF
jgi:hypothetical protein